MRLDYYTILGVTPDADLETIRRGYRKRSLESHPDRGGVHQWMILINEAWTVLSDENSRREYDILLRQHAQEKTGPAQEPVVACPSCRSPAPRDDSYCRRCGAKLEEAREPSAPRPKPRVRTSPPRATTGSAPSPSSPASRSFVWGDMTFHCPHCQTRLREKKRRAGTVSPCPSCGEPVRVPEAPPDRKPAVAIGASCGLVLSIFVSSWDDPLSGIACLAFGSLLGAGGAVLLTMDIDLPGDTLLGRLGKLTRRKALDRLGLAATAVVVLVALVWIYARFFTASK